VGLHGGGADVQLEADLGGGEAVGGEDQHLALARGQRRALLAATVADLARQLGLDLGREDDLAAGGGGDRVADPLAVGLLGDVGDGALGDRAEDRLAVAGGGEDDDVGGDVVALDRVEDLEAGELRHVEVEHGDIGGELADLLQGGAPVGRLADQLQVGAAADRAREALAIDRVVVGYVDRDPIFSSARHGVAQGTRGQLGLGFHGGHLLRVSRR
jgi:hypothetical protein